MRRSKKIEDSGDQRDAEAPMDGLSDVLEDTHGAWHDNMMGGMVVENTDAINSDQRNASRMVGEATGMLTGLKDDIQVGEQREAAQQDLDEGDDFEASEAQRMKRSAGQAGGRPKKSRMSVIALVD